MILTEKINVLKRIAVRGIFFLGLIFLFFIVLSFTTAPYHMYHWLGMSKSSWSERVDAIIILGGGGFPSESALMRNYYAVQAHDLFPTATIVLAMPDDQPTAKSDARKMIGHMCALGVDSSKIVQERIGHNTREQALNLAAGFANKNCLIITSPEHMRRAVLCFNAVGFDSVFAMPTFEHALMSSTRFSSDRLGGRQHFLIPEVADAQQLRYQFWNHSKYQIICYREYLALAYYAMKGWL
ncbi:MAG: hypothetical protein RIQ89_272 [Bacteroidota bacterium]|jgi:uncharacterized SAM-binding protein YcdF (DUF218 family)